MAIYDAPESLHVGNGVETVFGFNWPYLLPRDLLVAINGLPVPTVLASPNQVAIVPAPAALAIVRIYRNTPAQNPTYLFATGIPMLPKYIDGNNKQLLYALQEGLLQFAQTQATADEALRRATAAEVSAAAAQASAAQQAQDMRRTVRVPTTDQEIPTLPSAAARAGKVLGFDSLGNPVGTLPATGSGTELALDLASQVPGKGMGMLGYKREGLGIALRAAKQFMDATAVSIWEYQEYAERNAGDYTQWDWTDAINRALSTGLDLNLGSGKFRVRNRLVLTSNGQRLFGYGAEIISSGSGTAGTVVYGQGLTGPQVYGLCITPGAVSGALWTSGSAVLLDGCRRFSIRDMEVTGGRRGLSVVDCHDGSIHSSWIHDSLVAANPSTAQFGADVGVYNSCSGIRVYDNVCEDGNGQGIAVQTNGQGGHTMSDISLWGNTIRRQGAYGILLYSDGANATGANPDQFHNITIGVNTVEDITGLIPNPFDGSLSFGAGVYIQGVEGVTLGGVTVRRSNINTDSALLGPGGFALVNATAVTMTGCVAISCGKNGYFFSDPLNKGRVGGVAVLVGCREETSGEHGYHCNDFPEAIFTACTSLRSGRYGIFCRDQNTTNSKRFVLEAVTVDGSTKNGVTVAHGDSTLTGCTVRASGAAGVTLGGGVAQVALTTIKGSVGRGLELQATLKDASTDRNVLDGNAIQLFQQFPARGVETNTMRNLPAGGVEYAGTYTLETAITGATPSVRNGTFFAKTDTVSVTGFLNPHQGQIITIRAASAFTLINGGSIATSTGADVNVVAGRCVTLRYVAYAWRQTI